MKYLAPSMAIPKNKVGGMPVIVSHKGQPVIAYAGKVTAKANRVRVIINNEVHFFQKHLVGFIVNEDEVSEDKLSFCALFDDNQKMLIALSYPERFSNPFAVIKILRNLKNV